MAQPERPLSPFMQYRWQYTNTLSILHRITGILLSLCFFVLVYWLAAAALRARALRRRARHDRVAARASCCSSAACSHSATTC